MRKRLNIVIVSTFGGSSLNIGDNLITLATIRAIRKLLGSNVDFKVIFRAENSGRAIQEFKNADYIVFACLAIRRKLLDIYSVIPAVIESGKPFGVLAAGTSLNVSSSKLLFDNSLESCDEKLLRELCSKAEFFTTRGKLTQEFCEHIGLQKAIFVGDIAFERWRFRWRFFKNINKVTRIAISDPHYEDKYKKSLAHLIDRVKYIFPNAEVEMLLHGVNKLSGRIAQKRNLHVRKIYLDRSEGLDIYDKYDMHVGYRIHGHVSALSRGKPSYLLEQDGRGCDYGLSLFRKISTPHYRPMKSDDLSQAPTTPVDILLCMILADQRSNFSKFSGIEKEMLCFSKGNHKVLLSALSAKMRITEKIRWLLTW
ncbi:polysaccharide pyruvyl transferase family protein [uncultured Microbulbifer sp.]|uniref:polysaccharide pyruvyl transferase family protein n=1 Tax=uncultured Microbulbifer sp. TaxID=348147 RepID=UPI0026182A68|nr:polysaccharide pyruvyl transferase family protein [uncultured Microbulbifer sp.]